MSLELHTLFSLLIGHSGKGKTTTTTTNQCFYAPGTAVDIQGTAVKCQCPRPHIAARRDNKPGMYDFVDASKHHRDNSAQYGESGVPASALPLLTGLPGSCLQPAPIPSKVLCPPTYSETSLP